MIEKIQIHLKAKLPSQVGTGSIKHFLRVLICLEKNYCYLSNELNLQFYCTHTHKNMKN